MHLLLFAASILLGEIEERELQPFLPLIQEELTKEFSLQDTIRTRRSTREYGYSYFSLEKGENLYREIPEFLQELGKLVCQSVGHSFEPFTNVIVSVYEDGFHLEPHEDVHAGLQRGYFFGDEVYGVVIEPDETGHLYFVYDEVNRIPPLGLPVVYAVPEKVGATYCLQGEMRKAPYFHGVTQVAKKRISVTFRKVLFSQAKQNTLFQVSTVPALLSGVYEGDINFRTVALHGDTGLGTFNEIDGEMVACDDHFYRIDAKGAVEEVSQDACIPLEYSFC